VAAGNVLYVFIFRSEQINLDGRTTALGGNHNDIAAVMAIAIAMAWWLMTHHRGRIWSVVNLLYLPVGVFAVILTGSRGGTLAAVVALAAIVLTLREVRPVVRVLVTCAVLGTVAIAMTVPPDIRERALPALERVGETAEMVSSSDLTGRTEIWRAGYEALRENPIIGYGGDSFPTAVTYWLGYAKSAHNSFLAVAVNTGLIGLALFCLILLAVFVDILGQPRSATRTTEVVLFAVLLVSIFPLSWEYYKTTWFVLAILSTGPLRSRALTPSQPRSLVAELT
jgi:O-antigen ligase